MENPTHVPKLLIICGTILNLAALGLLFSIASLSATDVQTHRLAASSMLREGTINRVQLVEWEPPSTHLAWVVSIGGFGIIAVGVKSANARIKPKRFDELG